MGDASGCDSLCERLRQRWRPMQKTQRDEESQLDGFIGRGEQDDAGCDDA